MSIKANSFVFSDELINKMKNKYKESIKLNKEAGFTLCQNTRGEIVDRQHCIGTDRILEQMKYECPKNEKLVGDFHTHPIGGSDASLADLSNAYRLGMTCIAGRNEINCFIRKGEYDNKSHEDIYDTYLKYHKPLAIHRDIESIEKSWDKTEEMTHKYFNIIKLAKKI
jgi:proteasome lid subunit RPN8/RPN11